MSAPAHPYRLFLVPSASHAIHGERVLLSAGIACRLIPVPRAVSSQCGVCLRVDIESASLAEQTLARAGVAVAGTHDL
jgi:hypothetical protein